MKEQNRLEMSIKGDLIGRTIISLSVPQYYSIPPYLSCPISITGQEMNKIRENLKALKTRTLSLTS